MTNANKWGDRADFALGLGNSYRKEGTEGMSVFAAQHGVEEAADAVGESAAIRAAKAYKQFRTGKFLTLSRATSGSLGFAFTAGNVAGDVIKHFNPSIEKHATDAWYYVFQGRREDAEFDERTSDASIERHRQILRQRYQTLSRANDQAVAERRVQSTAHNPGGASDDLMQTFMHTMATINASRVPQQTSSPLQASQPTAPKACNKVYNTPDGCHPAHDEKAHPGGCRC